MRKSPDGDGVGLTPLEGNRKTAAEYARVVHTIPSDSAATFDDSDASPIEGLERIRRDYSHEWVWLLDWARGSRPRRSVLREIVERRLGATYSELAENSAAAKRTVKQYCYALRDRGFVSIISRSPRVVEVPTLEAYVLLADAASWPL